MDLRHLDASFKSLGVMPSGPVACVQTPPPSVKIGEGASVRFHRRYSRMEAT